MDKGWIKTHNGRRIMLMPLPKGLPDGYRDISLWGRTVVDGKMFYFGVAADDLHTNGQIDHFGFPTEKISPDLLNTMDSKVHCILVEQRLFEFLLRKQHDEPSKNIIYFQSKKAADAVVEMTKGASLLKTMSFLPLSKMSIPQKNLMDPKNFRTYPRHRVIYTAQKMITAWMHGMEIKSEAYALPSFSGEVMFSGRGRLIQGVLDIYEKMGEGDAEKYLSDTHMTIFGGELDSYSEHLFRMLNIDTNEAHPSEFSTLACDEIYTFPNRDTRCTNSNHDHKDWNFSVAVNKKRARDVEEEEGEIDS
jgi:hypothetical protein